METLSADFRDHLVKFQREGRFFSSSEPHFKEFLAQYRDNWNGIIHDLANYICVELLHIATAYEFDHLRLLEQTISRQDMMCLLLDAPETNRFVHRLLTTEQGKRHYQRVVRVDGYEKKGFGFLLSLQHLFKRWLALHGMWQTIPPSNAETALVQSDFNSEKAQVLQSLSHLHHIVIQNFSAIFDNLRVWISTLPNSSCDKDNFRLVINRLMNMQPQLCPFFLDSKVESMFACFDVDGNGSLDVIEIMHGFRTLLSRNQSSIADLAFRFADSSTETNQGPFSGSQNQKLDEDEFKKLIRTVCRDEPYVLQVILNKICLQEHPYFVSSVTQISAQQIEQLRFHPPLTLVRDFANPIQNLQHHQTLVDSLFEDQAGSLLLMGICRAVFHLRKQKSPHIDQHDFRQMFENNQLFGWMLRFWLLRGFLSEDHPQYLRLSGFAPPRDIQFSDNIEASEASARKPYQHLAWYFAAFNTQVDDLLAHLHSQYVEITGSPFGQINQSQFEKLISRIFTNLGIKDQIDLSNLFSLFDADQSGEISRKEIIDGFVQHFHRIETVFQKIVSHFERKMIQDPNMTSFCLKHKLSVAQFFQKLKDLFVTRSTSLSTEIDGPGFCALWKQVLVDLGIRSREDPRIDVEATHMFHVADTSGNGQIDFAELLYFVSEQCVDLLHKSAQEHQKITDLMLKAARYQEKHGTPQVLGSHTTLQFLEYAWNCFQVLAGTQKQDPVHFECSKQEFSHLWDELKHQLGFGDEDPLMHIDKVYNHIDTDGSGTISATEMIDGLIRHFLPIAEKSRSQSRAPQRSVAPSVSSVRAQSRSQASSASKPIKRPSITPGSPINSKVNAADVKLLSRVREEPWCRLAEEEFESIGEDLIGTDDFHSIVARLFEKKRIPIPSATSLDFMFSTFDTNGDHELSKAEFLCGMWRILAFADAAAASCDDHDDDEEEQGGLWEGDYLQYLRLAVVPVSENQMLNVDRLHQLFTQMLNLQISQQGEAWRPSGTLVNLFKRHQLILTGLSSLEDGPYDIDPEYQHIMKDIVQPGKTVDIDSMNEKISCCSFGLVCCLCTFASLVSSSFVRDTFHYSPMCQAFEMMFKSCHMNVEIDFARVCQTEFPVTHVMNCFFGEDCDSTR
jgi:Ca2+-binding EF-hand superfamily protein